MRIGAALFLIAVGAILKFAVTDKVNGIDLGVVGIILMIVGVVGALVEMFLMLNRRRTTVVQHPGVAYVDHPVDRTY
jgi:uncharacterized protein DUF6458